MAALRPGMTVFVPGMSGESLPFYDELRRDPSRADGVTFVGVHFPGINRTDYLALNPNARQRAYFTSPSVRAGIAAGRADLIPLDYPGIVRDLEENVQWTRPLHRCRHRMRGVYAVSARARTFFPQCASSLVTDRARES